MSGAQLVETLAANPFRAQVRAYYSADEAEVMHELAKQIKLTDADRGKVAAAGASDWTWALRIALSRRDGPIIPLETQTVAPERYVVERHLCIDTTAAGGNASLLASSS